MIEVVGDGKGASQVLIAPFVATEFDLLRDVHVDRPADDHIEDMAGDKPREHEHAKCNVARKLEMEVFEDFGERKEKVDDVHDTQNDSSGFRLVIAVRGEDKSAGDEVVGEHLPVVLTPFFDVDDHDLLQPEGELDQVVPFRQAIHLTNGPVAPEGAQVHPVVGSVHDVDSCAPGAGVVEEDPCLFGKA